MSRLHPPPEVSTDTSSLWCFIGDPYKSEGATLRQHCGPQRNSPLCLLSLLLSLCLVEEGGDTFTLFGEGVREGRSSLLPPDDDLCPEACDARGRLEAVLFVMNKEPLRA